MGSSNDVQVDSDLLALDQADQLATFTEFSSSTGRQFAHSVFLVAGMHCASCAQAIERALGDAKGILRTNVDFAGQRVSIRWDPKSTRASCIAQAIRRAGYEPIPARSITAENARAYEGRMALWRLLVAGFCMMQVMMYTVPIYMAAPEEITPDIARLLQWAAWMLSLPVLLFSAKPFFASAWRDISHRRVGMDVPVALGIGITFFAGSMATVDPGGLFGSEPYLDSMTMFIFFLLGGRYLEQRLRNRTAGALDAVTQRLPELVYRLNPDTGVQTEVCAQQLQPGDVIQLRAGQAFPADAQVLDHTVYADESLLTGESTPITKPPGSQVIAGSYNLGGAATVQVTRVGASTRFAQIVALMEQVATQKPRLAQIADRWAGKFLAGVLLAATLAAAFWWWFDPSSAPGLPLRVAVAVLIVTCPCALALATPSAMVAAAGALAKRGVLIQRLQALEELTHVDLFVFDKTGTLTEDRAVITAIRTRQGLTDLAALAIAAGMAKSSLHPVSGAICAAAELRDVIPVAYLNDLKELPGSGLQAADAMGQTLRLGSAKFCGVPGQYDDQLRCWLANNHGVLAEFEFAEVVKPDAVESVKRLREHGQVWLLSGDRASAASRVGTLVGADRVVGGATPEDKLALVMQQQAKGRRIAMVGDGLNDAPVLARAHVSFALGRAAPIAQAQSDFIVLSGKVSDVIFARGLAQKTLTIVRQNLLWAAAYNALCIPLAVFAVLPPWLAGLGMALSSLAVVSNALRVARPQPSRG
jgi:P-type Cu2+ transporter